MQACLGVAGGMLTLGGIRTAIHEIWMLKNETSKWDVIGKMHFTSKPNIAIQINGEIFVWSGDRIYLHPLSSISEQRSEKK
jgi:hypothetical protein